MCNSLLNPFSGLLKLEAAQREHVVLACTMTPDTNATFLEMDVDSSFILTPIRDSTFPKTPLYLKTKSYCEDEAESWQRQIKVRENNVKVEVYEYSVEFSWLNTYKILYAI